MLDKLTSDDFAPYLKQTFQLRVGGQDNPLPVELIEVEVYGRDETPPEVPGRRLPFSVVFRGPKNVHLPQGIYSIEHQEMGSFDLFLVPIRPDSEGPRFEAVFN